MTTCAGCATSYVGAKAEHCTSCHETFTNTVAGDRHRTGGHGVSNGPTRRRCRTQTEMLAAGLIRNGRGFWTRNQGQDMSGPAVGAPVLAGVGEDALTARQPVQGADKSALVSVLVAA